MKIASTFSIYTNFFLLLLSIRVIAQSDTDEISVLKKRLIDDALVEQGFLNRIGQYSEADFQNADEHLQSLQSDGSWPDIDYRDQDNSWDPLRHSTAFWYSLTFITTQTMICIKMMKYFLG